MADKWRLPAEMRCDAKKAKVPRSRRASSADGMTASRTLAAIRKESANVRRLSNCCVRREASEPQWVDASTDSWLVSQGVTPPCARRVKVGVQKAHVSYKHEQGEGGAKMIPPYK